MGRRDVQERALSPAGRRPGHGQAPPLVLARGLRALRRPACSTGCSTSATAASRRWTPEASTWPWSRSPRRAPTTSRPRWARGWRKQANDELAAAIDKYPDRLTGFAALAPKDPEAAAKELERAVKELGLKGWKTHSNFGDSYIDDKRYWPILAKAEELNVPIYLHPTGPMIEELRTYGLALAGAAFGFGLETATAMMRLVLSGAFDAFPGLKIILGHYGEGLPFLMQRIDHPFVRPHIKASDPDAVPDLQAGAERVPARQHAGHHQRQLLRRARSTARATRWAWTSILLGTDYPYEEMDESIAFLEGLGCPRRQGAALPRQRRRAGVRVAAPRGVRRAPRKRATAVAHHPRSLGPGEITWSPGSTRISSARSGSGP